VDQADLVVLEAEDKVDNMKEERVDNNMVSGSISLR